MRVIVRVLASHRGLLPQGEEVSGDLSLTISEGSTVSDLLGGLPIAAAGSLTAFVNGRHAERSQVLKDGDELSVFAAVGGG